VPGRQPIDGGKKNMSTLQEHKRDFSGDIDKLYHLMKRPDSILGGIVYRNVNSL
jgi:hypothetical protein